MFQLSAVTEPFARRFEPDGDGYVFRHSLTSPAYRVTAAERDRFVADFGRGATLVFIGGGAAMLALLVGGAWWSVTHGQVLSLIVGVVIVWGVVVNVGVTQWLWGAPSRALRGRASAADGLSRPEARRQTLRRLSWMQLAAGAGFAAIIAWRGYGADPGLTGEGRLWLGLAAVLAVVIAVQALRKWRSGRG
ncbi:MAG: hypothetical protein QM608_13030 [Caulobacter sp.]